MVGRGWVGVGSGVCHGQAQVRVVGALAVGGGWVGGGSEWVRNERGLSQGRVGGGQRSVRGGSEVSQGWVPGHSGGG